MRSEGPARTYAGLPPGPTAAYITSLANFVVTPAASPRFRCLGSRRASARSAWAVEGGGGGTPAAAVGHDGGTPFKLLLLARSAAEWWTAARLAPLRTRP